MKYVIRFKNEDFLYFREFYIDMIDAYGTNLENADLLSKEEADRIFSLLSKEDDVYLWNKDIRTNLDKIIPVRIVLDE